jgi:histidine transport system ATP-binding protein
MPSPERDALDSITPDSPQDAAKDGALKLVAKDIHKRFGDNEVLKGVSLTARAGDVISIIGSSGSGKSTFLRCINFLERPNAGQIVVDGEPVRT